MRVRTGLAAVGIAAAGALGGCTTDEPSGLPPFASATTGSPTAGTPTSSATADASAAATASGAAVPSEGGTVVEPDDPAAVVTLFADDFLAMLSAPGDPALRTSPWASDVGLAAMAERGEQAATDQLTSTGQWQVRVDDVSVVDVVAVVSGCIDVSQVQAFRSGVPAPFPGDLIAFSADADRRLGAWRVNGFSIPGQACPDA